MAGKGGTTEQLRRANLGRVLQVLHEDGPHSRADLTRAVGLSRSTMVGVVTELEDLGLIVETSPNHTGGAGRPSGVVQVAENVVAVSVNPEVDAVHVGLVGLGGRVVKHARIETPDTEVSTVVALAAATITGMLAGDPSPYRVLGLGLAIPGQVRVSDGLVREATHLGWTEVPIAELLHRATDLPAWAANAATLAMRAESRFGAARGMRDLVYFIGGASGVGGGAILDGRLMLGTAGYAGEFGHTVVRPGGAACHCGGRGCLEVEVDRATLMAAVGLAPVDAGLLAQRLGASTDPAVTALVAEKSAQLAIAVRNALNMFNPEAIVLSGYLAALHEASTLDLVAEGVASSRETVAIHAAALGEEQLMIGAAELVWSQLLADPVGFVAR
jgi:predicted NBD/HSP70 family sugar kinase